MTAIAEMLDKKMHEWEPQKSKNVELLIADIIGLADDDALDLSRSRGVEQEVLDILDES
jgi:hypothetical protein